MKKSLYSIMVIALSLLGFNAFASKMDIAVNKVTIQTEDQTGAQNGLTGGGNTGSSCTTREK